MHLLFDIRYYIKGKRYRFISDSLDIEHIDDLIYRLKIREINKLTIKSLWV